MSTASPTASPAPAGVVDLSLRERLARSRHRWKRRWRVPATRKEFARLIGEESGGREVVVLALTERIGDFVASEPMLRWVRTRHPDAFVIWAVHESVRDLAAAHPAADAVLAVRCISEWASVLPLPGAVRLYDGHFANRFCFECGVPIRKPDLAGGLTWTNYLGFGPLLHVFCACAGLPKLDDAPQLHLPPAADAALAPLGLPSDYVVVHRHAREFERNWMFEKWAAFARAITDRTGLPVLQVGAPGEGDRPMPEMRNLCGRLTIPELAVLIRGCRLFVGVESGPAHLANALLRPGLVLQGRYRGHDDFMPYTGLYAQPSHRIHAQGPLADLETDRVIEGALGQLADAAPSPISQRS